MTPPPLRGAALVWTVVTLLLACVLGGIVGRPLGERIYAYQWSDARFCNDCHAHDYANEAWERSAHAGLTTCHDCHRVPIRHYPRNLWVTITTPPKTPQDIPHPEVPVVICEQCHVGRCDPHELSGPMDATLCDQVVKVDGSRLHAAHLDADHAEPGGGPSDERVVCEDCHGGRVDEPHRFESSRVACTRCHEDHEAETVAGLPCRQCHGGDFFATSAGGPQRIDNDQGTSLWHR
jgi:hypothetical protein